MANNKSLAPFYLSSIGSALIWAFMVIPIRQLHGYDPFFMLLTRIILATILLYLFMFTINKKALKNDFMIFKNNEVGTKKKVIVLILISGLCLALNWFTYIYLIVKIDIKSASVVYVITPLLLAVGSFVVYKEALDKIKIAALFLAFVIIIFFSYDHLHTIAYVLFCSASYATFMLLQKALPKFNRLNLFAFEVLFIFLASLPFFLFKLNQHSIVLDSYYWSRLLLIAVCFTILPMFLNLYGLSRISGSSVAMIIYLNPIASFIIGVIIFDESLLLKESILYGGLLLSIIIFNYHNIKALFITQKP